MSPFDLPPAVLGFVGVHLALRAEVGALASLVDAGETGRARRRAELLGHVLHQHHVTEDRLLWPALVERQPGAASTTAALQAQHEELTCLVRVLPDHLDLASRTRDVLVEHLLAEEQHALPLWLASFDGAEHERFAALLRRSTPWRAAGPMVAWLLDATPDDARGIGWQLVPRPLQVLHRLWWQRSYEHRYGRIDTTATTASAAIAATAPWSTAAVPTRTLVAA